MKYTKLVKSEERTLIDNPSFNNLEKQYNKIREDLHNVQTKVTNIYYDLVAGKEVKEDLLGLMRDVANYINSDIHDLWQEIVNLAYK